ncbi:MAG: hypothetical protein CMG54_03335 [Candidatus Marinimicrobia bacterium]|nr:hypothetical protein [Candidatus Neomarinimicrobiota bacterium]
MVISSAMSFWPEYQKDFLISFLINFANAVIGYLVSKKYFNAINSIFYTMIYGTMFLRFILMLTSMLILILNGYVNMVPFFLSFMAFYVLFQIFEINSLLILNKVTND